MGSNIYLFISQGLVMNALYKKAFFAACLTFASIAQALDVRPAFKNRQKEFIEFIFIDSTQKAKAELNNEAKNLLTLISLGFLGYKAFNLKNSSHQKTPSADASETSLKKSRESYADLFATTFLPEATPRNAIATVFSGLAGYELYKMYQAYISWKASILVLTNFLSEWDINQEYTPESYHDFFNELTEMYEIYGDELFYDSAEDIVEGLQFIIKRTELKVSEVYKKEFENNASGSTIFDTPKFLGDILKHSKEIIKL